MPAPIKHRGHNSSRRRRSQGSKRKPASSYSSSRSGSPAESSSSSPPKPKRAEIARQVERVEVLTWSEQGQGKWMVVPLLRQHRCVQDLIDAVRGRIPFNSDCQALYLLGSSGQPAYLCPTDSLHSVIQSGDRLIATGDAATTRRNKNTAWRRSERSRSPSAVTVSQGLPQLQNGSLETTAPGLGQSALTQTACVPAAHLGLQQTFSERGVRLHPQDVTKEKVFWIEFENPPHWVLCLQHQYGWEMKDIMQEVNHHIMNCQHVEDQHNNNPKFDYIREVLDKVCVNGGYPEYKCVASVSELKVVGIGSRFKTRMQLARLALAVALQLTEQCPLERSLHGLSSLVQKARELLGEKLSEYTAQHSSQNESSRNTESQWKDERWQDSEKLSEYTAQHSSQNESSRNTESQWKDERWQDSKSQWNKESWQEKSWSKGKWSGSNERWYHTQLKQGQGEARWDEAENGGKTAEPDESPRHQAGQPRLNKEAARRMVESAGRVRPRTRSNSIDEIINTARSSSALLSGGNISTADSGDVVGSPVEPTTMNCEMDSRCQDGSYTSERFEVLSTCMNDPAALSTKGASNESEAHADHEESMCAAGDACPGETSSSSVNLPLNSRQGECVSNDSDTVPQNETLKAADSASALQAGEGKITKSQENSVTTKSNLVNMETTSAIGSSTDAVAENLMLVPGGVSENADHTIGSEALEGESLSATSVVEHGALLTPAVGEPEPPQLQHHPTHKRFRQRSKQRATEV